MASFSNIGSTLNTAQNQLGTAANQVTSAQSQLDNATATVNSYADKTKAVAARLQKMRQNDEQTSIKEKIAQLKQEKVEQLKTIEESVKTTAQAYMKETVTYVTNMTQTIEGFVTENAPRLVHEAVTKVVQTGKTAGKSIESLGDVLKKQSIGEAIVVATKDAVEPNGKIGEHATADAQAQVTGEATGQLLTLGSAMESAADIIGSAAHVAKDVADVFFVLMSMQAQIKAMLAIIEFVKNKMAMLPKLKKILVTSVTKFYDDKVANLEKTLLQQVSLDAANEEVDEEEIFASIVAYFTPSTTLDSISILKIPEGTVSLKKNTDVVDFIQNMPLPNNIEIDTTSSYKADIDSLVTLLGSYTTKNSIEEMKAAVVGIHARMVDMPYGTVRSWVDRITGIHPTLDGFISKNLPFFMVPYSEVVGTNTLTYVTDTDSTDISNWGRKPTNMGNTITWNTKNQNSLSFMRESVREKLPSGVVYMISSGSHTTSKAIKGCLIYDAFQTTKDGTGGEDIQERPIPPKTPHGTSLNNDWCHPAFRILPGDLNKKWSKDDVIFNMFRGGCPVHVLINHLEPLTFDKAANLKYIGLDGAQKIETVLENKEILVTSNGQRALPVSKTVTEDALKPEEVKI